jgi:hypothetical protein
MVACLCLLALAACGKGVDPDASRPKLVSYAVPPADPLLGNGAIKAVAAAGRLWLVGWGGGLVSLELADNSRQNVFADGVMFLAKSGGVLWVLRSTEVQYREIEPPTRTAVGGTFVVSKWTGSSFEDSTPLKLSEMPTALVMSADGSPIIVSPTRINTLRTNSRHWAFRKLKGDGEPIGLASAAAIAGDDLYVGFNAGEFGGGLRKISLSTGIARYITDGIGEKPCAGCEPITGVITDPTSPRCILASIGLMHMLARGQILQICGGRATIRFEKTFTPEGDSIQMTVPFFDLAAAQPGGFWAVAPGTLYRFEGRAPKEYPLPKPQLVHGLLISRDLPGVIIVYTNANQAFSLSGATPLLATLD